MPRPARPEGPQRSQALLKSTPNGDMQCCGGDRFAARSPITPFSCCSASRSAPDGRIAAGAESAEPSLRVIKMHAQNTVEVLAISLLFGGPILFGLSYTAIKSLESLIRHGRETNLKMQMVERGFSAAEIQLVLQQTGETADGDGCAPPPVGKPIKPARPPVEPLEPFQTFHRA